MAILLELLKLSKRHSVAINILLLGLVATGSTVGVFYLRGVEMILAQKARILDLRRELEQAREKVSEERLAAADILAAARRGELESQLRVAATNVAAADDEVKQAIGILSRHAESDLAIARELEAISKGSDAEQLKRIAGDSSTRLRDSAEHLQTRIDPFAELGQRLSGGTFGIELFSRDIKIIIPVTTSDLNMPADTMRTATVRLALASMAVIAVIICLSLLLAFALQKRRDRATTVD